jgi:hypothetical protein
MRKLIVILLSLVLALPVTASQVRELNWDDSRP